MSFIIKCDKCGKEQTFKDGDNIYSKKIHINVNEICGYEGCQAESIEISCVNGNCFNSAELKFSW